MAQNESRQLVPTDLGFLVTDLLVESFPDILNVEFTAGMEDELDKIEDGKEKWTKAMKRFYTPFARDLKKADKEMRDVKRQEVPTDIACEKCGAMMVIKWGRNGEFIACPHYPECKNTKNFKRDDEGEIEIAAEEEVNETCEKCGRPMLLALGQVRQVSRLQRLSGMQKHPAAGKAGGSWASSAPSARKATSRNVNRAGAKCFTAAISIPSVSSRPGISRCRRPVPTATVRFSSRRCSKRAGRTHRCYKKECGYSIPSRRAIAPGGTVATEDVSPRSDS